MKLLLTIIESTCWKGVVEIEDELFKVTFFPGSATEEWRAILQPTAFVRLTQGGELEKAISRAHQQLTTQEALMDEVNAILSKARKGENHEGDDKTG